MAFVFSIVAAKSMSVQHSTQRRTRIGSTVKWVPTAVYNLNQHSVWRTLKKPPRIAVTRESGKNQGLMDAINQLDIGAEVLEMCCVETVAGPDLDALPDVLTSDAHDWLAITSPEGANVVIDTWRSLKCPQLPPIAAVGRATGDILRAVGLDVSFEPTRALGKVLAAELPGTSGKVLYAGSLRAPGTLQKLLSERGFEVQRLNTYSTEQRTFSEMEQLIAEGVHIVTFASPSAVASWVDNVGVQTTTAVACIGETSANAARVAGFDKVHYPHSPGMQGWIEAIEEALKVIDVQASPGGR